MRVLVACEFSQIVTEAFTLKGHNVISCDLLPAEKHYPHYQGDVFDIINDGFDLMIAHPPCTHLAVSGARHFHKKKHLQDAALNFVIKLMHAPIKHICVENPISIISTRIRKPDQIINPYQFGDPIPKKTCLWLKGLPLLKPTNLVEPEYIIYNSKKNRSGKSLYSIYGKLGKGNGKERSKFFPGIAKAMSDQWNEETLNSFSTPQKQLNLPFPGTGNNPSFNNNCSI